MLNNVYFSLSEKTITDVTVRGQMESTAQYIKENGYESGIHCAGGSFFDKQDEASKHNTLVITDSDKDAQRLIANGFYCAGVRHGGNPKEQFNGIKYVLEEIDEVDIDSFVKIYQRSAGEPWDVIMTERLLIRETTLDDVDEFYKLYQDPEMTKYMEGLFENPEDEKRYQRDYIEKVYGLMGFGIWTIVRREDGRIIGRAGYSVRNGFDEIELGFLIGKEFQNQGYAYEACSAILEYGKEVLLLDQVQALVKKENEVSIHICQKLGFVQTGTVSVEENIYGREYIKDAETDSVRFSEAHYGEYIRFYKSFKK
ncbi:GNAT family N-acetyltransferase [Butyrivibrio sp. YAB3001]|uniref:GNAT family N-acetyltransferase n=1 Tax=Butyrivibrio sp. YAB3001 TaxID=1520812 RepID=UPI0008F6648C|nr:GNAT family N-acetyltransferase [Butyrivibrio sp. YAB3001]SFC07812.1 Protein N-acetyltransferase, RimJ/RimL family [Butyrivibrio sp. YAB3001]